MNYGGHFLKEILASKRMPISARQFKYSLNVFLLVFFIVSMINLLIVTNDFKDLSNYLKVFYSI